MDGFNLEGTGKLVAKLQKISDNVARDMVKAVRAGANVIRKEARSNIHRQSGQLRKSITVKVIKRSATEAQVIIGPNKRGFYGRFLEFGTSKMAPKPFLRPALGAKQSDAEKATGDKLRELIQEAGKAK